MGSLEIILIALALSMDAFAVSVAIAATGRLSGSRAAFRLSFHFGLFQFMMPVLGWAAGTTFEPLIAPFDHWVAFALLLIVAVRMLRSGGTTPSSQRNDPSRGFTLLTLATATSIDALAVGLSLAMLRIAIWIPSVTIGLITGLVSSGGIFLGNRLQLSLGRKAELVGGIILIVIAVRIVVSHTIFKGTLGG